jgi:hypothetical protein
MNKYLDKLEKTGKSLQIYKNGELIFSSSKRGVRPHLDAIEEVGLSELKGSLMVDKIIGRAAALLILYVKAAESYALVISKGAKQLFDESGIQYSYRIHTQNIKTENGVIYCPFEQMVQGINEPEKAYHAIKSKMTELQK